MSDSLLERFCCETSFHGFSDMWTARNLPWKIIWGLLLVVSTAFTIYEIFTVFDQFKSAPVTTSQEVISQSPAFPYIVLCSLNGINYTKIAEKGIPPDHVTFARLSLRDFTRSLIVTEAEAMNGVYSSIAEDQLKLQSENIDIIDMLFSIGFDQHEFIKQCTYNSKPCTSENVAITPQYDVEYGACFALKPLKPQDMAGVGLNLLIDTHKELTWPYHPSISDGITVKFEDQLNSATFGQMLISPGTHTRVDFKFYEIHLQEWNGNEHMCVHDIKRQYLTLPYTSTACALECVYNLTQDKCGCVLSRPDDELVQTTNMSFCRIPSTVKCATELRQKMFSNCSKMCLPACLSNRCEATSSHSTFPSEGTINWLRLNKVSNSARWETDYILLQVAFEELEITKITQYPSLTPDAFISQVGGQIGLFLGASLLSVVQIITLITEACIDRIGVIRKTARIRNSKIVDDIHSS